MFIFLKLSHVSKKPSPTTTSRKDLLKGDDAVNENFEHPWKVFFFKKERDNGNALEKINRQQYN